jgi:GNAT superfamily N-acetyltransferase
MMETSKTLVEKQGGRVVGHLSFTSPRNNPAGMSLWKLISLGFLKAPFIIGWDVFGRFRKALDDLNVTRDIALAKIGMWLMSANPISRDLIVVRFHLSIYFFFFVFSLLLSFLLFFSLIFFSLWVCSSGNPPIEKIWTLEAMVIHPDLRGEGVGSSLVRAVVNEAKVAADELVYLTTELPENEKFYQFLGFETIDRSDERTYDDYNWTRISMAWRPPTTN